MATLAPTVASPLDPPGTARTGSCGAALQPCTMLTRGGHEQLLPFYSQARAASGAVAPAEGYLNATALRHSGAALGDALLCMPTVTCTQTNGSAAADASAANVSRVYTCAIMPDTAYAQPHRVLTPAAAAAAAATASAAAAAVKSAAATAALAPLRRPPPVVAASVPAGSRRPVLPPSVAQSTGLGGIGGVGGGSRQSLSALIAAAKRKPVPAPGANGPDSPAEPAGETGYISGSKTAATVPEPRPEPETETVSATGTVAAPETSSVTEPEPAMVTAPVVKPVTSSLPAPRAVAVLPPNSPLQLPPSHPLLAYTRTARCSEAGGVTAAVLPLGAPVTAVRVLLLLRCGPAQKRRIHSHIIPTHTLTETQSSSSSSASASATLESDFAVATAVADRVPPAWARQLLSAPPAALRALLSGLPLVAGARIALTPPHSGAKSNNADTDGDEAGADASVSASASTSAHVRESVVWLEVADCFPAPPALPPVSATSPSSSQSCNSRVSNCDGALLRPLPAGWALSVGPMTVVRVATDNPTAAAAATSATALASASSNSDISSNHDSSATASSAPADPDAESASSDTAAAASLAAATASAYAGPAGALLQELLRTHLCRGAQLAALGPTATAPRGVLLCGPPGVGKTYAVRAAIEAVANEIIHSGSHSQLSTAAAAAAVNSSSRGGAAVPCAVPCVRLLVSDSAHLRSQTPGESEARLRGLFAHAHAPAPLPALAPTPAAAAAAGHAAARATTATASSPFAVADMLFPLAALASHSGQAQSALSQSQPQARVVLTPVLTVLFLDEIDALAPRRAGDGDVGAPLADSDARLVAQLLTLIDGFHSTNADANANAPLTASGAPSHSGSGPVRVVVVGATNRRGAMDPALRRPGRLDRELVVAPPDAAARAALLTALLARVPLAADVAPRVLAEACVGFVAADLHALVREAALAALRESTATTAANTGTDDVESVSETPAVALRHFRTALGAVGAASLRGHALNALNDKSAALSGNGGGGWADEVGGLEDVKLRLRQTVEWPLRYADTYKYVALHVFHSYSYS